MGIRKLLDKAYRNPYVTQNIENVYNALKFENGSVIDSFLATTSIKTRLQALDALTYCYVRMSYLAYHDMHVVSKDIVELSKKICSEKVSGYYENFDDNIRIVMIQYETCTGYAIYDRVFIVHKEILAEDFTPVVVFGMKIDNNVYYSYSNTFTPVQVALDSVARGGIYREYCERYYNEFLEWRGSPLYSKEHYILICYALSISTKYTDFIYSEGILCMSGKLYELNAGEHDVFQMYYLDYISNSVRYINLMIDNDMKTGLLDLSNNLLFNLNSGKFIRVSPVHDSAKMRRFIMSRKI